MLRSRRQRALSTLTQMGGVIICVGVLATGCELVAAVDRSESPADSNKDSGGAEGDDAGTFDSDAAVDATDATDASDGGGDASDGGDGGGCTALLTLQASSYALGNNAAGLAIGHFNGGGVLDVVVTNRSTTAKVGILLGSGAGAFGAVTPFASTTNPLSVAVADLNGDAKADLVAVGSSGQGSAGTVSVLLGNGDGTFQAQTSYPVGEGSSTVAIGDLDGNGSLDIVTANLHANSVSILLGSGNGTFATATTVATGAAPVGIALAKLNADAHLDIVVVNQSANTASVLLGNGNGTFQAAQSFATSAGVTAVAVGDLNGDAFVDVVAASGNASGISVLLGNGDGSLQPKVDYVTGNGPYAVALGDVSGDGKLDIVASVAGGQGVDILRGNGNGTFAGRETVVTPGEFPTNLTLGDVNGDGKLDAVVVTDSNLLQVLLNGCP